MARQLLLNSILIIAHSNIFIAHINTSQYNPVLNRLMQIWEEVFATPVFDVSSDQECPMLIGVMRRSVGEKRWLSTSEYEFESLLERDKVTRTMEKSTPEISLRELIIFKEKCDESEQILVSF
jgi:hypothetical protein